MTPEELKEIKEQNTDRITRSWTIYNSEELLDQIEKLLAHVWWLESQIIRWRKVEDGLPEKAGIYLIFDPNAYGVETSYFHHERGAWEHREHPTHWAYRISYPKEVQ